MNPVQQVLIDVDSDDVTWDSDSYETPDPIARYMANLIKPTDERILEPAAGTGQIVKFLADVHTMLCIEKKHERFNTGALNIPDALWLWEDFLGEVAELTLGYFTEEHGLFDLIITNPPFSHGMEFLERSLQLLNPDNPEARLIYLLPADYFQTQGRAKALASLDGRIYQRHSIVGRIAYLKNGVSVEGRQCCDCIFDIRPGKAGDSLPEIFVNTMGVRL